MNQNNQKDLVFVASREQLINDNYYRRLWMAVRSASISRREWLDEIADTIRDYRGLICYYNGFPYQVPDIDDTFGNDSDMRWLGYFIASNDNGNRPKTHAKKIERLRLIDLYFRIKHPHLAKHFAR